MPEEMNDEKRLDFIIEMAEKYPDKPLLVPNGHEVWFFWDGEEYITTDFNRHPRRVIDNAIKQRAARL